MIGLPYTVRGFWQTRPRLVHNVGCRSVEGMHLMSSYRLDITKRPQGAPHVAVDTASLVRTGDRGAFALCLRGRALDSTRGESRDVAVKVFRGGPEDASIKANCELEYGLLERLAGCSHVVQLYGSGTITAKGDDVDYELRGTHRCLVESLAKEVALDTAVEKNWLSNGHSGDPEPAEKLAACVALADAVAEIASRGVVQRDLGPDNVFLRREQGGIQATLIDFGNGQMRDSDPTALFDPNVHLAKWEYGAPEMFPKCEWYSYKTEPPVDVFSLGAICYWLLSGEVPFGLALGQHASDRSVEIALTAKRNPPRGLPAKTVEELGAAGRRVSSLVARCLSYRPKDRPTAREVAGELGHCLSDLVSTPVMPQAEREVVEATPPMPQQEHTEGASVHEVAKTRVHDLAKEFGMSSKEIMGYLRAMNVPVASASSILYEADADLVRKKLKPILGTPAFKIETQKEAEAVPIRTANDIANQRISEVLKERERAEAEERAAREREAERQRQALERKKKEEADRRAAEAKKRQQLEEDKPRAASEQEAKRKQEIDKALADAQVQVAQFADEVQANIDRRNAEEKSKRSQRQRAYRELEAKYQQQREQELRAKLARIYHARHVVSWASLLVCCPLTISEIISFFGGELAIPLLSDAALVFVLLCTFGAVVDNTLVVLEGRERTLSRSCGMKAGKRGFGIVACLAVAATLCSLLFALQYFFGPITWLSPFFSDDGVIEVMSLICAASWVVVVLRAP